MKKSLLSLLVGLLAGLPTWAQAPDKMTYQAIVHNGSGQILQNTPIGLRVQVLQGSPFGAAVFVEEFSTLQTNNVGLLTTEIGTGTTIAGDFTAIDWGNGSYYLKTEIDPNAGSNYSIISTQQLLSIPYAFYAQNANKADTALMLADLDAETGEVLKWNGATWSPAADSSGGSGWHLSGNAADSGDFIGTTNNQPLVFKVNGDTAGFISAKDSGNIILGYKALNENISGYRNIALGYEALYSNTMGYDNIANGYEALYANTDGSYNIANGYHALYSNTEGDMNIANGYQALASNTTGSYNIANGHNALASNTTGAYNIATGNYALSSNTTGSYNIANGYNALSSNTTGYDNIAIGYSALSSMTSGHNNTGIGAGAQVPSSTGSNQVRIGNTGVTYAGIQVAWTVTSDRRLKERIKNTPLGLSFVNELRPVSYIRKNDDQSKTEYGFIAQEVAQSLKDAGVDTKGLVTIDDEGMYSLRYNDFIAISVKAIQQLSEQVEDLKKQLRQSTQNGENLKATLTTLQSGLQQQTDRLNKLEALLNSKTIYRSTAVKPFIVKY